MTAHDRIHAREPTHDRERWRTGTITALGDRDGHCVVTVDPDADAGEDADGASESVDLWVTFAVRDLFVGRLDLDPEESPVGSRVWFRKTGGR